MNWLRIRNANIPCFVLNERQAPSGIFVLIFFAKEFVILLVSPFFQLEWKRKMAARFFFYGDHLAEVILLGTSFLRPGQYHRTFFDSG